VIAGLVLAAVLAAGGTFSGSGGGGSQSARNTSALPANESCREMAAVQVNGHTSCPFAINVFKAYWSNYKANKELNTNVDVFSRKTGQSYVMSCRYGGGVVNCTGGIGARVVFPLAAVQTYAGHS